MKNRLTRQFLESTVFLFTGAALIWSVVSVDETTEFAAQPIATPASLKLPALDSIPPDLIHLDSIPFARKKPDFGGETCIAMYLRSLGHKVTADEVFEASTNPNTR